MNKSLYMAKRWFAALAICLCTIFLFAPAVHADTNGTELQVTEQPDTLVIQLGPAWAGVEFELRTDAGVYPQPVVVTPEGVLSLELGGSHTYTLSAMNSPTQAPPPDAPVTDDAQANEAGRDGVPQEEPPADNPAQTEDTVQSENPDDTAPPAEEDNNLIKGIPNMHLFLFAGGLIVCIAGLIIMAVMKRRKNYRYDDSDDYDDYDD